MIDETHARAAIEAASEMGCGQNTGYTAADNDDLVHGAAPDAVPLFGSRTSSAPAPI
jgi:hypothetical protein